MNDTRFTALCDRHRKPVLEGVLVLDPDGFRELLLSRRDLERWSGAPDGYIGLRDRASDERAAVRERDWSDFVRGRWPILSPTG